MPKEPNLLSWDLIKSLKTLVLVGAGEAGLAVALAFQIKSILNTKPNAYASNGNPDQTMMTSGVVFLLIVLGSGYLKWRGRVEAERLGQNYVHKIRLDLFDHLSRLSFRVLARKRKGPLLLRFMNDLTALRQWVAIGLSRLVMSVIIITTGLGALFFINTDLAIALSGLFLIGGVCAFLLGKSVNLSVRHARKRRSILASGITEKMLTMPSIQMLARRQKARREFKTKSGKLRTAMNKRASFIGMLRGLTRIVGSLAIVITVIVGSIGIQSGQISSGDLLASIALVSFLSPALYDLGRVYEYWHGAQIAQEKIKNLFKLGPTILPPPKGQRARLGGFNLRFKSVSYAPVLKGINVQTEPGDKIALLGANGAGKSTLLQLIMRLDDPDRGDIQLGGKSIKRYGIGSLRRAVTLISSDATLFKGTVESNLCYPNDQINIDREKPFLLDLGLDIDNCTSAFWRGRAIREGGANLSKGEKSAILIARAFLMQPEILLLDEIDVHLDKNMKAAFYQILATYEGTVIAASHNLAVLNVCNRVWHLQDGKIENLTPSHFKSTLHTLNISQAGIG